MFWDEREHLVEDQVQKCKMDDVIFLEGGASRRRSSLRSYIPMTLPLPLHSWIDVGENMVDHTI
jgi:hypothetical protein